MNKYLITPYQGKPYILEVPKDVTLVSFESALYNKHKNYYESHLLATLPNRKLEKNNSISDTQNG